MRTSISLALIFGLLLSCNNSEEKNALPIRKKKINPESMREYVIAMEDSLALAYRNRDAAFIDRFYAENAVSYGEGREQLFGKQQILNHFRKKVVADSSRSFYFRYETIDVFNGADDILVETGKWIEMDKNDEELNSGYYMVMFQEQHGRWVAVRDIWNTSH